MPSTQAPDDARSERHLASGVRAAYDAVAHAYDAQLGDELDHKPLDQGLLQGFIDLVGAGTLADVGCGPGHVTRLIARHADVIGIDLSIRMIQIARERAPTLAFAVGSMLQLPVANGTLSGAIALYSIIHLSADERAISFHEFARVVRPGGWLLVAFHIDSPEFAAGDVNHLPNWFGESVDFYGLFLEPNAGVSGIDGAGFAAMATVIRQPWPGLEYPSRRCYVLAQRS
jgi:SAM-dependent methyltransferase